ncbi:hypothetical protein [Hydrogenophaga sp.]|uniref:hypothetical protein n=1 Tax=Hydrogenophaga sp. TaxID=1904254 RepID=UPI0035B15F29
MGKVYSRKRATANRAKRARQSPTEHQLFAHVNGDDMAFAVVPKVTIAQDLLRLAEALPSKPVRGRGRPRKDAPVALSRQQRRYQERMLAKAHEAISKLEGGKP